MMGHSNPTTVVGLDWGTTHRRAYAVDAHGACTQELADGDGALACKGRFAQALQAALDTLAVQPGLVVMSGMVGSALGWHEVPYVNGDVALQDLAAHALRVSDAPAGAPCLLLPGYCLRNAAGLPDVMRGEETQLLGAWALGHTDGWFVLPGTHSKWVELRAGRVVQLRTYMTGELFDLFGQHGTLAAAASASSVWDDIAFAEGVRAAGAHALSHQLFGCRARVVSKDMPAASSRSYLSGLLIGTELKDVLQGGTAPTSPTAHAHFKLLGSPQLAALYQTAAGYLGLHFDILDARQAFVAAVHHIHATWKSA
ncbi:MAG: 2-dehydro-3-deoxygalactonokinase [Rhodoferax sp.]|nr:2-dehydro-3-deoxygalactonokinase [Rhodoferax sp.]